MDVEAGPVIACSQREKTRSYKDLMMDVEKLEEPNLASEDCNTKKLYNVGPGAVLEPEGSINKKKKNCGDSGVEPELYGLESSSVLPEYPVCVPRDRWEEKGEEDINLLHSCCTAEGSIDQTSPSSMSEYWVYLDNQHNMADCPETRTITPPVTPVTQKSCPFIPVPTSATAIASAVSSVVNPMMPSPMTDTSSPISSMCSPTSSAWDALRSTSRSPGCCGQDPVSAAAHLHLLGESLSLIGHHLQETSKMVSVSSSLSLLLDSLLCALGPLICLTTQIPELRSCNQHTLASTLENIAYVMPGL
ncbi:uncharacterized protein LOC121942570 [Plectropomus leopardus]|uniref:uncharacterized protein LOC121942570 n=1 Tax=Plectropomus leopardus TaxID=160734 RepID=UPI001C4D0A70|nr:uncharacterized protein LOC121942570 [Plectropomus leopardus]XP_042341750.1 uncharacterized protein LOC121942570 [Plectropomus leopardus]XP_042341751.1 uncharacterized protein LOC121942570 [Plectropomus leopardus]